ncbi:MAG: tRNA lysidine(34) synthetase TilS [Actinomycetota bacterium]
MSRRPPAVARVLERITATAREHHMFDPGDRVLVMASGGPDSTCLLSALHMLRRLFEIELEVFHFDHRLRPDSGKDAQYVRRLAAKLELAFHLRVAADEPAAGDSVEEWARVARWSAANELRGTGRFDIVAAGHTLNDQAETLLLALLRGGGLHFVAGMPPKGQFVARPLLDVNRDEVEAFVRALGLRPRVDPTNRDTRLLRNAIRLRVMPELERAVGRSVVGTLARTAGLLRADADELFRQGAAAYEQTVKEEGSGCRLEAASFLELPEAIAGRVVELAMWRSAVHPEMETIRAVLDLARGRPGRKIDLPGGFTALREREYIRISRPSPEDPP